MNCKHRRALTKKKGGLFPPFICLRRAICDGLYSKIAPDDDDTGDDSQSDSEKQLITEQFDEIVAQISRQIHLGNENADIRRGGSQLREP